MLGWCEHARVAETVYCGGCSSRPHGYLAGFRGGSYATRHSSRLYYQPFREHDWLPAMIVGIEGVSEVQVAFATLGSHVHLLGCDELNSAAVDSSFLE